jgi:hypothetical protein
MGGALAWGWVQNSRRNRPNDPVARAATKALHADPDHYEDRRPDFTEQVKPPPEA